MTGRELAIAAGGVLVLAGGAYVWGHVNGSAGAEALADHKATAIAHAAVVRLTARADTLERQAARLAIAAEAAQAPHVRSEARTDTAAIVEAAVREEALKRARDSTAHEGVLRGEIERMAAAELVFAARVKQERDSAQARLDSNVTAVHALLGAVAAKDADLEAMRTERTDVQRELDDLKNARPGVLHRAATGVVTAAAAGLCGLIGSLGGPGAAIGAGMACAAVVGAWSP